MIDKTDPTNRDTVPAMLTPGEFVLNKEATQMFGPVVEQMNNAGLQHRAMKNMGGDVLAYNEGGDVKTSLQEGILETAKALGIDPVDLATIISYETAGTLSATKKGPTTKYGQHRGYIQFGEPQAEEYGVDFSSKEKAMSSQLGANGAIVKYFKAHGFEPGMGLMDLYSIVNTGGPGRYDWTDEKAGGAKGTVSDKVINQMPAHRDKAIKLLGINFAPETSIRPQARGEVPTQAVPEFIAQMDPQTVEQVSVPPVRPQMRPTPQAEPLAIEQAVMRASVPQMQEVPPSPSSFGEAFKDARADMGAGGIFTFRGNDYTTNYAEEEDKRMTANMGGAVHLNTGGMSIDQMARRKLQEDVDNAWFKRKARDALTKYDQGNLAVKRMLQKSAVPSPMQTDIDTLPMALPSGGSQQEPGMPDLGSPRRVPPMSPPMPDVNSDESLLQGSSKSVDRAFKFKQLKHGVPKPGQGYGVEAFGSGNIYTNGQGSPVVKDPRNLGGSEGYGQTGDATSRRAAQQQRLIALRENLTPGSPEHIKVSKLITGSFTPSMTSLDELVDYNIPASIQDAGRMMANNVPVGMANVPPAAPKIPLMKEDIVQAQQVSNPYDFNPYGNDPMGEIPKVENSDGYTNEELRVLSNTDNAAGSPWAEILQERTERQASELRSELQEAADNGIVPTQSSLNQLSDLERQSRNASEVKTVNDQVVAANQQSVATTKDALGATERERRLRAIERAAEYGITVGDGPSGSSEDVTAKVAGIINNIPEGDNKTSKDQDLAAKEAAAAEEARLNQVGSGDAKNTPEVKGAMSAIKSMFGDLFDTKELARAAILYLGGRATGLNGNQALAFAGKNYLARVDAKEGTYQKAALAGTYTKDSLAVYRKTMNPADLVAKDQPAIETGNFKQMYDSRTGRPVTLIEKETSTGQKLYYHKGRQVVVGDYTNDGRYSPRSEDYDKYLRQLEGDVVSQVKELNDMNMTDSDSNGKGSKPIIDIPPSKIANQVAKYTIKNQLPREVMRDLVSIAYQDALAEKQSTGKTPSSMEPFFERAFIKSKTSNVVNFTLANGKPAPAKSVNQFFTTIRDMATATERVNNPEFKLSSLNDVQLSTWLLQSDTYTSWNQIQDPEEKKFFVDRGSNEVPPRSGFMQYVLEGYPK